MYFTNTNIEVLPEEVKQLTNEQIKRELQNIQMNVENYDKKDPYNLEMNIKNIDYSIINALRRIIMSEVPTMAIHRVLIYQNTSVIPDEVLAHRLGLIPIRADARFFEDKAKEFNDRNSIKFKLKIKCTRKPQFIDKNIENMKLSEYLDNHEVFASDFVLQDDKKDFEMVYKDILVAKLAENQEIILDAICQKGNGAEHAKYSPVSTVFYKLKPKIVIKKDIEKERAELLKKKCPKGVFDVKTIVKHAEKCDTCRECIREEFNEEISLQKEKNDFIFTIESVGQYKAFDLLQQGIQILQNKAKFYEKQF